MATGSIKKRPNGMWRARYRDADGKEHARHFKYRDNPKKPAESAQHWLDQELAALTRNDWTSPELRDITIEEWCRTWLEGYATRRSSTVLQARSHVKHITTKFGDRKIASIRPSEVKSWMGELKKKGLAASTVHAIHSRLGQILGDAVHDGIIPRSPVSRRTSPGAGSQRPYVATTEQIWALHDALPEHARGIVLLGAFVGLRRNEMIAVELRDVDFIRGVVSPARQYPDEPLKTEISKTPIPIPQSLALELNRVPSSKKCTHLIVDEHGRPMTPSTVNKLWKECRESVEGLPEGFRIHDLRHYFASMLIDDGIDIKTLQARLRHASATTTLNVYGHLLKDKDESSRAAVDAVLQERFSALADQMRTGGATS